MIKLYVNIFESLERINKCAYNMKARIEERRIKNLNNQQQLEKLK